MAKSEFALQTVRTSFWTVTAPPRLIKIFYRLIIFATLDSNTAVPPPVRPSTAALNLRFNRDSSGLCFAKLRIINPRRRVDPVVPDAAPSTDDQNPVQFSVTFANTESGSNYPLCMQRSLFEALAAIHAHVCATLHARESDDMASSPQ